MRREEFYLTDVARLNRVYLAAKRYCLQPDQFSRERLRQAIEEAENA
jgi:predicted metallo-beta-lactamase superfamily hydrolase